ncbi:Uncharacterised protein [Vibrio cholerae]|uniref:Uncharacterized protein n=1 Tax=Vibrio cholerae TaxID=666 RepID=A0A655PKV4_VIBCL|nr:Uncharacterised protein [Vibrio cholerae]CSA13931.1 Uncharacterised protein [Vibrio cholerae]CSA40668.1 Uncharacterised protein [Vibrio cholerae]CSA48589.1 Uncharacterised protein [Vibrio cholerae]CSB15254.1 Uncharacterised protein [Vibrio cholerae]
MFHDLVTQLIPVVMQRLCTHQIDIFLISIDWHQAFRVVGLMEQWATTLFFRQLHRSAQQVILHGFKRAVRQAICAAVRVFHTVFR